MRGGVVVGVALLVACGSGSSATSAGEGTGTTKGSVGTTMASTSSDDAASGTSSASGTDDDDMTTGGGTVDVPPAPDGFEVGVDSASITPTTFQPPIWMGSYGLPYSRAAEGVHDEIHVRSLALGLGPSGVIFAVTDLPGMGNQFTRAIRDRVARATGLAPHRVIVGATHTHSAPDFQGLWGGGPDAYRDAAVDTVVASMVAAWDGRAPAGLEVATTVAPNNNRRDWGFTDDELVVIRALGEDRMPVATLAVFAAHPTVLGADNLEVSADWCGYAVSALEAQTGAPALVFNGILGDASPAVAPGRYANDFERAEAYGQVVADAAMDGLARAEPVGLELVVDHRQWTLVGSNALFNLAAQLGLLDYDYDDADGELSVETLSSYIRLGEQVQIVTFPGEPLTRLGLPIKDAMVAPHRIVLGQTHDMLGYFVPSDEWMTGHNDDYEESISLGPMVGDISRDVLIALIEADAF